MKRFIVFLGALALTLAVAFTQRDRISHLLRKTPQEAPGPAIAYYTCSMHPQIRQDGPGNCPICHMPLVAVYAHQHKSDSISIDGARQQISGIRVEAVRVGPIVRTVRATGKAAIDVELASAVREFIALGKDDPALYRTAVTRLKLLGMGEEEIRELEKNPSAENLYRPAQRGRSWIYATIYESDLDLVRTGQPAVIRPSSAPGKELRGTIRSISPVVDQRSLKARILVNDPEGLIRPEASVTVEIQANLGTKLTVPRDAVVFTGKRSIVFVALDDGKFSPRQVTTSHETEDRIIVESGLRGGERIVSAGAFLVESEARLQSALEEMEDGND